MVFKVRKQRIIQKLKSVLIVTLVGLFLFNGSSIHIGIKYAMATENDTTTMSVSNTEYALNGSWDGGYDDAITDEELSAIWNDNGGETDAVEAINISDLHAASAVLMDASTNRVLYEKNGYEEMAMASTTKIITCIIALEYGNLDEIAKVSSYAASMPKVKLGVNSNEEYILKDLLYSLMLESHNDVAVVIAEHIAGSVEGFAALMNQKARDIGAFNTNFVTPNGLDAEGHCTTAADLALIASYAIKNKEFIEITNTPSYTFSNVSHTRTFTVNNKNAFLNQMPGAFGIKTGYTGKAGYCFVGALEQNGKRFVSVVLASGWPPNKTYKWLDTKKLMNYGLNNYSYEVIFESKEKYKSIQIIDGKKTSVMSYISGEICILLNKETDVVEIKYNCPDTLDAPVKANETIGFAEIYVNGEIFRTLPIKVYEGVDKIDYKYCLDKMINLCLP